MIFTKLFIFSGCKIKALRAKTNTYIKTPVRGEEPVFVVTGRKEDVALAKREILSAADHFSQIRASRKSNINSTLAFGQLMANTPGQTTVQVRVPYRVVGLVVGPKGATINVHMLHPNLLISFCNAGSTHPSQCRGHSKETVPPRATTASAAA